VTRITLNRPQFLRALVASTLACACIAFASPSARAAAMSFAQGTAQRPVQAQPGGTRVEALLAEGAAALERGDEAAARASFERVLTADPENVSAHTYLGILCDRAGDLKAAERHFAAAAMAAPFLASARNNYGAILLRNGRTELAAAQFEASLKLERNQPSALVNLAQIRFNSGRPEDLRAAHDLFARALLVAPDAEIARALVVVALRLGEREAAAAAYRDYAARVSDGSTRGVAAASRAELGAALAEAGLVEEAVAELNAAVSLDPSNETAVVALSRAQLKRKDIPAAGRALEAAVARGLDTAPIYAALADVYEAGGYVENAIPAMRLAIARDPRNELYHLRYGMLLNDTKAPAAAIIRLGEAVREFPESPRLWLALGIAQLSGGKNEDAQKSFERSLELEPRSVPALAYLGSTYGERGLYAQAISFYERAIAADARQATPFYLAADALLRQPDVDVPRVEKYLGRAIELDPDFVAARMALAKLYVRAERWAEAAAQFEHITKLDPQSSEAHYQLGRVYVRLKRTADAQRELDAFKHLSEAQKEQRDADRRELLRRLANVRF
jgi:Tfp pilus assembly protein PilF